MGSHTVSKPPLGCRYLGASGLEPPGLASLCFDDVEEQASALTGWNQDYLQLSAGAFQGEICQLQGTGIKLFIEQLQQTVFQTGALPRHVLAVGIPLDASGTGMFCGKACEADDFHVFSGACGFEFRTSRQHTMLGIELQLDEAWLNAGARELPAQACALRMTPAVTAELRAYLLGLFRSAQANSCLLSSPAVASTVADFLLDRMLPELHEHALPGARSTHWSLVQQACELAHDRLEQAPTVAQLCVDLGVSRRTLQNGFQRVLDVSPLVYLKAVRLGQARRALKRANSVTQAATAYGFWHFGHFSQDYQAMFGERPSDTLRRHTRA